MLSPKVKYCWHLTELYRDLPLPGGQPPDTSPRSWCCTTTSDDVRDQLLNNNYLPGTHDTILRFLAEIDFSRDLLTETVLTGRRSLQPDNTASVNLDRWLPDEFEIVSWGPPDVPSDQKCTRVPLPEHAVSWVRAPGAAADPKPNRWGRVTLGVAGSGAPASATWRVAQNRSHPRSWRSWAGKRRTAPESPP